MTNAMKKDNARDKNKLDLSTALRILENAGCPDPRLGIEDPEVQVQSVIDALCDLSIHDGLTGLAATFSMRSYPEIERSQRTGRTCGLMAIDLDFFKQINDTFGHATAIKRCSLSPTLQRSMRGWIRGTYRRRRICHNPAPANHLMPFMRLREFIWLNSGSRPGTTICS
jgi:hypothetical protein